MGTPQLLMLSGVGPKAELERLNISMVLHNEFVGKGMADDPMKSVFVLMTRPVEQSLIQTVGITKMGVYIEASSGFGKSQDSIRCHHGMLSAEIGQLATLPPKQRTKEATEAFIKSKKDLPHEAFKGGFILENIAVPLSTGHLNLVNTKADDNPSVTFNYFSHPRDLRQCVNGIRMAAKVIQSDKCNHHFHLDSSPSTLQLHLTVPAASKETPAVPPQQQCSISFHHLTSCPSTPTVTRGCPFVNDIAPTTTTQLVSSPASNARFFNGYLAGASDQWMV